MTNMFPFALGIGRGRGRWCDCYKVDNRRLRRLRHDNDDHDGGIRWMRRLCNALLTNLVGLLRLGCLICGNWIRGGTNCCRWRWIPLQFWSTKVTTTVLKISNGSVVQSSHLMTSQSAIRDLLVFYCIIFVIFFSFFVVTMHDLLLSS